MNDNFNRILAALEQAVLAYNPAIGATVIALAGVAQDLASAFKATTGNNLSDVTQEEWAAMTLGWQAQRDALLQSIKDHPGT